MSQTRRLLLITAGHLLELSRPEGHNGPTGVSSRNLGNHIGLASRGAIASPSRPPLALQPEERTMRLGLLGGSFDPVHYGHLLLAECCREQGQLEQVWFLPAAVPPHKQDRALTSAEARIEMLELAIAGQRAFAVNGYEIDRGGVSYTVDTLRHFRQQGPEAELFLLMGADMLYDLPQWRQAEQICRLAIPMVACRPGAGALGFDCLAGLAAPERIELFAQHQIDMPQLDLSSREIRRRVAAGLSIRYQTPRAVEKYIETHALYG